MYAFIFFPFFVFKQIARPSNGADDIETVFDEGQFDNIQVEWAKGFDSSNILEIKNSSRGPFGPIFFAKEGGIKIT